MHWPSSVDGSYNRGFGPKTKLLIVDALTLMTKAKTPVTEAALRSVAVRLYDTFDGDRDGNVKGCIATLIQALLPALRALDTSDFMQGHRKRSQSWKSRRAGLAQ